MIVILLVRHYRECRLQYFRLLFYCTSGAQKFFFLMSLHQIDNGATECNGADNSHISRHLVIEFEPVDICIEELLEHQYQHRSGVTDKVDCHDEKSYITFDFETGDEAVEEDTLETEIGNVKAQTLDEQPSLSVSN
jgi:hypothetical protein